MKFVTDSMVRVSECFECGINEKEDELVFTPNGPLLCKKCNEKIKE